MSDLNKALGDISSIRRQMARSTEFRGYGPATLCATGVFALMAAAAQAMWLPDAQQHVLSYLGAWVTTAVVSAALIGYADAPAHPAHSFRHGRRDDPHGRRAIPAFRRGRRPHHRRFWSSFVPAALWMLPGLWQITFSLGVFSSCRFLPRPMLLAGAWYLATGLLCLALGDARAFSPWAMGIPYGAGQLLVGAILHFTREDVDE